MGDLEDGELVEESRPIISTPSQSLHNVETHELRGNTDGGEDNGGIESQFLQSISLPSITESDSIGGTLLKNLEIEARNDLIAFLKRKGIPESAADQYQITVNITRSKSRKDRKSEPSTVTYYTAPDGSMLSSKIDVMNNYIQLSHKANDYTSMRIQAHEEAKSLLKRKQLPFSLKGIKVLNLGEIDVRSGFHSATQIWPIGYRCEQVVEGSTLNGIKKQNIICQIGMDERGFPQFHIFVPSTDGTHVASSEANVWRKVFPL
jgi:hypothetical protein